MAKPAPRAKSCATCACFLARRYASEDLRAAAARAGIDTEAGRCRRFPAFVERKETDWCGEHREKRA